MRVLSVASEVFPLVKTGGLADVAGALPRALLREGVEVKTLVPGYPAVLAALEAGEPVLNFGDLYGGPARVLAGTAAGLALFVLDAPHLFGREGNPYVGPDGQDWPDNAFRFAALARAAAAVAWGEARGYRPDVVHGHDWQAGLAPAFLASYAGPRPPTVMTVHNVAFTGAFPRELLGPLGLPPHLFGIDGVEFYGQIGFLKAGLQFADRITTVSPTYAAEIQTPEAGFGLDGLLRYRAGAVTGILNGIDDEAWDPAADARVPAQYNLDDASPRAVNKAALQERFGLARDPGALLLGVVSRLSWQKGLDLLPAALAVLLETGAQLAVLGSGDAALEQELRALALRYPDRAGAVIGYDEDLAHLIQAGADALLVPSRFEPCGLTQLCALRYGAVPVVSRVGGLADTVIDNNEMARAAGVGTGVVFSPVSAEAFAAALRRIAALWADPAAWAQMQRNGMMTDVSWSAPARRYAALYRELTT